MEPHPTVKDSMFSIILFTFGILAVSWLLGLVNQEWRFIIPVFFVWLAVKPLLKKYLYGLKNDYSTKQDRRYKGGYKITGSTQIIDKSKKEELSGNDKKILRVEGTIKLIVIFVLMYRAYPAFAESSARPTANPKEDLLISNKKWEPEVVAIGRDRKISTGPSFAVTNKSKFQAYHRVYLNIYFYDKKGKLLDSTDVRVFETVKPGATVEAGGLFISSVPLKAKAAKATIQSAIRD